MIMPETSTMPMRVARAGAGAAREDERKMAGDGGHGGHQDRAQAGAGGFDHGVEFALPASCSLLANSTMRMPFFATRPTSVMRPTWL